MYFKQLEHGWPYEETEILEWQVSILFLYTTKQFLKKKDKQIEILH